MKGTTEIQDLVVSDTWIDKKTGEERSRIRPVGVSMKMKGGGWRHIPYKGVTVGECMSLPRRERVGGDAEAADEPESGEAGDGWRE